METQRQDELQAAKLHMEKQYNYEREENLLRYRHTEFAMKRELEDRAHQDMSSAHAHRPYF